MKLSKTIRLLRILGIIIIKMILIMMQVNVMAIKIIMIIKSLQFDHLKLNKKTKFKKIVEHL